MAYSCDFNHSAFTLFCQAIFQKYAIHCNTIRPLPANAGIGRMMRAGSARWLSWTFANSAQYIAIQNSQKPLEVYGCSGCLLLEVGDQISLIDELGASMSYNMAASYHKWSDLSMRLRLKWWKNYTFNMNAVFATYAYDLDENGKPYVGNHTEWGRGRFGRFQGMSQNISYTLTPEKIAKLFGGGSDDEKDNKSKDNNDDDDEGIDTDINSNVDDEMVKAQNGAKKKSGGGKASTDDDGYMRFSMPWSITFGYGITMRENTSGKFNYKSMRYPYSFSQTLNMSGNLRISDGWNISFSSGYDFDNHKISMTTASLQRDLHCFNMSCSVVLAPYTSYNFTFRCNAATLTDALKYDKRSGYSNAVQWY